MPHKSTSRGVVLGPHNPCMDHEWILPYKDRRYTGPWTYLNPSTFSWLRCRSMGWWWWSRTRLFLYVLVTLSSVTSPLPNLFCLLFLATSSFCVSLDASFREWSLHVPLTSFLNLMTFLDCLGLLDFALLCEEPFALLFQRANWLFLTALISLTHSSLVWRAFCFLVSACQLTFLDLLDLVTHSSLVWRAFCFLVVFLCAQLAFPDI